MPRVAGVRPIAFFTSVFLVVALCSGAIFAQSAAVAVPTIAPGSKVFIGPMGGFENFMAAALIKKKVPLEIVTEKAQADYIISGTSEHEKAGWAKTLVAGDIHSDDQASVSVSSAKSGQVVFAYSVNKKSTWHGEQTSAEACAKHLKEFMEQKR